MGKTEVMKSSFFYYTCNAMSNQMTNWSVQFKNGEELDYQQVFQLYYRPLCYFAQKILKDQTEAEDIVTESFIKLLTTTFNGIHPGELRSFLFAITRNSCIDFLRKQKRILESTKQPAVNHEGDGSILENEMLFAQVLQMIYAEIENLPEQSRHVFKGIYFEGKGTDILAAELSISRQTVLNHKSRAVHLLKTAILKKGIPELVFFLLLFSLKI